MPDTPFKSMSREKRVSPKPDPDRHWRAILCEKCGGYVYEGEWPFCKGEPSDHYRD